MKATPTTERSAIGGTTPQVPEGDLRDGSRMRVPRISEVAPWVVRLIRRNALRWTAQIVVLLTIVLVWEYASGRWIPELFISKPSLIWETFWGWLLDGTLIQNAQVTVSAAALGFLYGGVLGIAIGYALAVSQFWASVFEPYITALYALPRIALIPVLILWVGIGQALAVTISAIIVFFLIFWNTFHGIRDVRPELIDAMRVMGGSRLDVARRVRFPSALVWISAGAKMSVPYALVGVVVAEMLASNKGLGYLVRFYAAQFQTDSTFAALLALLLVAYFVDRLVTALTRRALIWKG